LLIYNLSFFYTLLIGNQNGVILYTLAFWEQVLLLTR